jgi:Tol biopolymer transport system component
MKSQAWMWIAASMSLFTPLLLAVPFAVQQAVSVTNGQIAFTQGVLDFNCGAPANIFTANPNGSNPNQVPLPEGTRVEILSVPSPDGSELLISHTLRLDNTGQCCFFQLEPSGLTVAGCNQLVPSNPPGPRQYSAFEPHWSPDGTHIIFCMFINGGEGIYTANPMGLTWFR